MKNWPWYGYLVIAVLIFALAFFFYFKPRNEELSALRAERIKVEAEVQELKKKKLELDKIEAELVTMTAQLKELETIIPQRREIAGILSQVQQLAYDTQLEVVSFRPQGELNREFYSEWPIPIQVTGNFNNLGLFFDRIGKFPRLFTVENYTIKSLSKQTDLATVSANWTLKTYVFLEEPKAPAPKPKTKRPGR
jgi:type IV pilus assembly protein PilO